MLFLSIFSGCLTSEESEDGESHLIIWEEVALDKGGIFSDHPLHKSMDMEFIPSLGVVLVSEWPKDDDSAPVISTWRFGGVMEKIGQIPFPERGDVVYSGGSQCGIKLALMPDLEDRVFVYRCMSNTSVVIESYDLDSNGLIISDSRENLLTLDTGNSWGSYEHLVGEIEFGREGDLWVFMGYGNMDNTSQDPKSPFGSVLRMVVNGSELRPSTENPYLENDSWNPLVYAKGLRMPWTAAQDNSGSWWIGDVGEFGLERIQLLERPGENFGFYRHTWIKPDNASCTACERFSNDRLNYSRGNDHIFMIEDSEAVESFYAAIWVGEIIPDTNGTPSELRNSVIFGDFTRGFVRSIGVEGGNNSTHIGHLVGVVDMEVLDGHIYALTTGVQVSQDNRNPGIWRMVFPD